METNIRVKIVAVHTDLTKEAKIICTLKEAPSIIAEMRILADKDKNILMLKMELLGKPIEVFEAHVNNLIDQKERKRQAS